jgi:hypothetical protein
MDLASAQALGGAARRDRMFVTGVEPPAPMSAKKLHSTQPDNLERAKTLLSECYNSALQHPKALQDASKAWNDAENKVAGLVDDLVNVFQDEIFPFNKFTRRKAALKGATLHLPGLIRAVISDWFVRLVFSVSLDFFFCFRNYKRFWSSLGGGGERKYNVVVAIDTSASMQVSLFTLLFTFHRFKIDC